MPKLKRLLILITFFSISALAAPPKAEIFGALPDIGDIAISPDGQQIAYFINNKGQHAIRVLSLDGSDNKVRIVGLEEDTKPGWITWANNEQVLAQVWVNELFGYLRTPLTASYLYTLNSETLEGKILIRPKGEVIRQYNSTVVDMLYDDPDHILMSFFEENRFRSDLHKVDIVSGRYTRAERGRNSWQYWVTDLRGEPRVGQGIADRSRDEPIWSMSIRDADGDTWRDADEFPGLEKDADVFGFTSDPNEMLIGLYNGRPTLGLYVYDLNAKKVTRELFHNEKYDVQGVVLSADGSEVAGASYVADTREVELFDDFRSSVDGIRKRFPGTTVDFIDQSDDSNRVLLRMSSPSDPGAIILLDKTTGALQQLARYRSKLDPQSLGGVVAVHYPAGDGTKIPAYLTLPPSVTDSGIVKDLPFVILPHGGPYARDVRRYDNLAQFIATRGYAVLQMNFRGSVGYGDSFEGAGRKNWPLMHQDIEDGARWLVEKGYADPERICIAGWSFGGYAALMGVINDPSLYQCAISIAGVTDLQDLLSDSIGFRFGRVLQASIRNGFKDKKEMLANSPVERAEDISVPVFLAHANLDERVGFDQFTHMRKELKRGSAKVTDLEIKNDDHSFSKQKNRIKLYRALDTFLRKSLGASEHAK